MQFHQDDWRQIIQSSDRLLTFYGYWTKKEAVIKADGRGLNIPLADIHFMGETCAQVHLDNVTWNLRECKIDDGYKCFLASTKNIPDVIVKSYNEMKS